MKEVLINRKDTMRDLKVFPSGFLQWMRTHHDVVAAIQHEITEYYADEEANEIAGDTYLLSPVIRDARLEGNLYSLAMQWTDEYSELHKDKDDLWFTDNHENAIAEFLYKKINV